MAPQPLRAANGDGALGEIRTTYGTQVAFSAPPPAPATGGTLRSAFTYDLMGRQIAQSDYDYAGTAVVHSHASTFNQIGQKTYETDTVLRTDNKTATNTSTYALVDGGGQYLLGAVDHVNGTSAVTGSSTRSTLTSNVHDFFDGAVQASIVYDSDTGSNSNPVYTTTFTNDVFGQTHTATIADGRPRTVYFTMDGSGQIVRRDEVDGNGSNGDPHEIWYRFNGRELGYLGNDGTDNLGAAISIHDRQVVSGSGAFRNGQTTGLAASDTSGGAYEALNSYSQGSAAGGYVVQQTGESLRSIALQLWGDGALWYKLAEANGLSAQAQLVEGQHLNVPAGVARSAYNADTLKPYDANDAIGNVSPTTPKPKKANNCGVFGQVLLAAVAIAVTALVGPGPLGAIAGSAASQGVGVATGIQDKFSFKAVAMAGITAGVASGIGSVVGTGAIAGSQFLGDVVRGAATSAVSQGIGVATGLQGKFSWTGVATAGIGNGIGAGVAREMATAKGLFGVQANAGSFGNDFAATGASAMANAATRSALTGSSFGDNLMRALPDALGGLAGRAVGNLVTGAVAGDGESAPKLVRGGAGGVFGLMGSAALADLPLPEGMVEIVVTGRRLADQAAEKGKGFFDRLLDGFDGVFDTNLGGDNPHNRSRKSDNIIVTYRAPSSGRAQAEIANAQLGQRLFSSIGSGANYLYRGTMGPGTLYDRTIVRPFYGALGAIANSPLGDPGVIMSIESAGPPGALSGSLLSGVRGLAELGGAVRVARVVQGGRIASVADDPLAIATGRLGSADRQVLYHYTNEAGLAGITESNSLNPSLWRVGTKDVRYGNGQYVSDIAPGIRTSSELSRDFLGIPFQGSRFSHYVEIDASGLGAVQGRAGVYVIPNEAPLDLTGRIISSGRVPGQ